MEHRRPMGNLLRDIGANGAIFVLLNVALYLAWSNSPGAYILGLTGLSVLASAVAFGTSLFAVRRLHNRFLMFAGTAQLAVAIMDTIYIFTHPHMGLLVNADMNVSLRFWAAGRWLYSLSMTAAPAYLRPNDNSRSLSHSCKLWVVAAVVIASMPWLITIPSCMPDSGTFTSFMKIANWATACVLAVAVYRLIRVEDARVPMRTPLMGSILAAIISHITLALSRDATELSVFVGQFFQLIAVWLASKALIKEAICQPLNLTCAQCESGVRDIVSSLDEMGHGLITVDEHGKVKRLNVAASRITGWSNEDAIGETVSKILVSTQTSHAEAAASEEGWTAKFAAPSSLITYVEVVSLDGQVRKLLLASVDVCSENGQFRDKAIVFADVTEEIRRDQFARVSIERYSALFENMLSGVVVFEAVEDGADFTVSDMNSASERIEGVRREDVIGQRVTDAFQHSKELGLVGLLKRVWFSGEPEKIAVALSHAKKEGRAEWRQCHVFRVPSQEVIMVFDDISERIMSQQHIEYLTMHDSLTGLYNRRYMDNAISRFDADTSLPISVIMGDINGLKLANDAFGHEVGDRLLVKIAGILTQSCRDEDIVARTGGDEFVVIMPGIGFDEASSVVSRIRSTCAETPADPVPPSIALGLAARKKPGHTLREIITDAETLMYRNKLAENKSVRGAMIDSLIQTMMIKTGQNDKQVARQREIAQRFSKKIGLRANTAEELKLLISLHDIGMVGISDEILSEKGELSVEERAVVKTHAEIGYRIAQASVDFAHIADAVLAHHENWDGTGYPQGLRGEEIPILSRIVSMIDAYDGMTTGRAYRPPLSKEGALNEIESLSGTRFDPELANAFIEMMREDTFGM